jgi:chaperonin cofactor prefoldin
LDSKSIVVTVVVLLLGAAAGYGFQISQTSTQNANITDLESSLRSLGEEVASLEDQLETLSGERTSLSTQLGAANAELQSLETDYDALTTRYDALTAQYDQLVTEYESLYGKYQAAVGQPIGPGEGPTIDRSYSWSYMGKEWSIDLLVPRTTYDYFAGHERPATDNCAVYVTNTEDDAYMSSVAERFLALSRENGFTKAQEVNFAAGFVQSLPYMFDNVTTGYQEYARYPFETLVDGVGDCECKSILTAQLLVSMSYEVVLLSLPEHVAVGVYIPNGSGYSYEYEGKRYLYLETTREGWTVGEVPPEFSGITAVIYPIEPVEIISYYWQSKWVGDNLAVDVTVKNSGTSDISGFKVEAGLDAGNDLLWSITTSNLFDLASETEKTITLTLTPQKGLDTRLVIYLIDDEGYAVDEQYSGWFNT